ncbi:MAG: hypothetical protein AAB551_02345 [Patescibacteria group bacterium]
MNGVATKKVIGGKLLRVKSVFGERIESVQLTGDFFLHPEDLVSRVEEALVGIPVASSADIFLEAIRRSVSEHGIQLIGIAPEDIASTLLESFRTS